MLTEWRWGFTNKSVCWPTCGACIHRLLFVSELHLSPYKSKEIQKQPDEGWFSLEQSIAGQICLKANVPFSSYTVLCSCIWNTHRIAALIKSDILSPVHMTRVSGEICWYKKYRSTFDPCVCRSVLRGKPAANRLPISTLSQWQRALIGVFWRGAVPRQNTTA